MGESYWCKGACADTPQPVYQMAMRGTVEPKPSRCRRGGMADTFGLSPNGGYTIRVRISSAEPKGRFESCSLTEDWSEGSRVRFVVICLLDNNPGVTLGETNGPGGQPVKAWAESHAEANKNKRCSVVLPALRSGCSTRVPTSVGRRSRAECNTTGSSYTHFSMVSGKKQGGLYVARTRTKLRGTAVHMVRS